MKSDEIKAIILETPKYIELCVKELQKYQIINGLNFFIILLGNRTELEYIAPKIKTKIEIEYRTKHAYPNLPHKFLHTLCEQYSNSNVQCIIAVTSNIHGGLIYYGDVKKETLNCLNPTQKCKKYLISDKELEEQDAYYLSQMSTSQLANLCEELIPNNEQLIILYKFPKGG